jgi:cytochrome c peroxidase
MRASQTAACRLAKSCVFATAIFAFGLEMAVGRDAVGAAETAPLALAGKALFFDTTLSADQRTSCATCHQPELAFSDGLPVARGADGKTGMRNTPSLLDVDRHGRPFWDGRADSLESQILGPFLNPIEHGLTDAGQLMSRVKASRAHVRRLTKAFGVRADELDATHVAKAIAEFERTLSSGESAFDRYLSGNSEALSASAIRGLGLFKGRGRCATCHDISGPRAALTDNDFHNVVSERMPKGDRLARAAATAYALGPAELDRLLTADPAVSALGLFNVSKQPSDIGKFKTPSLRNVALTAPYMHDGSIPTLEGAVEREIYYRSSKDGVAVVFTPSEKADLLALLRSMTSDPPQGR